MVQTRINVTLDEDLLEALTKEATDLNRSVADVIREHLRLALFGKERVPTIREFAESLLVQGLDDEAVLAGVRERFPEADTSKASVSWYRSQGRKKGLAIPSQREARAAAGRG
ncbi:MAG: ribbon-helix-helix domain-containing protein [Propionibacteriaceae bacterium]|nr:ribbon-helix-helix domain-containing protein [Propionibacteriaceae bacterium]